MHSSSRYSRVLYFINCCLSIILVLALASTLSPVMALADESSKDSALTLTTENGKQPGQEETVAVPSSKAGTAGTTISVSTGKYEDIQAALDKNMLSSNTKLTVNVTKGCTLARPLYIYSNTTLQLGNGVVIKRGSNFDTKFSAMLYAGGVAATGKYDKFKTITITGGIWDGGSYNNQNVQILSLRHGQNITVANTVLQNATNHMINVAASKNVTIKNVTFKNAIKHVTNNNASGFWGSGLPKNQNTIDQRYMGVEAIHTDVDTDVGEPGGDSPHDGVPAMEIAVSNCIFDNVLACVGTHHTTKENNAGKKSGQPNVTIYRDRAYLTFTNNTLKNVHSVKFLRVKQFR